MKLPDTESRKLLDTPARLQSLDAGRMLSILGGFPDHIREANKLGSSFDIKISGLIRNVVITGLGGSAIGGEVVQSLASSRCSAGIWINRDYRVPAFVGEDSLVAACSYSGNTEETISAYLSARDRRASVIAISSGGELGARALADGVPLLRIPAGYPPRTAIAFSIFPLLWILRRAGLWEWPEEVAEETITAVATSCDKYRPEIPGVDNAAKQLALHLHNKLPVIYAPSNPLGAVATRWKGQFAENAKSLAWQSVLPEMTHNEIVGWVHPECISYTQVVCLRDRDEHPQVARRFEFLVQRLRSLSFAPLQFWGNGESLLERVFSLIVLGDYASVYLAFLYSEDPTPVAVIEQLKQSLKGVS